MTRRIYFDFNATTPLAHEVVVAMEWSLREEYGNPSSLHWAGIRSRDAVEAARSEVAAILCCDATEVIFTSGGTEGNNHAVKGVFYARPGKISRPHIISTAVEHPSILRSCEFLNGLGADVTLVPVDRFGRVDPEDVRDAIRPETILITVMHANNEVGTIQPIEEIARISRERGVVCHTDGAQTVGKIPVDVELLDVDLLTVAGHKLYGPKGVGALYVREGTRLEPFLHGADHEAGQRAGTENVAAIIGLGAACRLASEAINMANATALRDYFWQRLQETFGDGVTLNGHLTERLPNTLNVSFVGHCGGDILAALPRLAASTGSACHAGMSTISPVLEAMGTPREVAIGAIRFSLGRTTTAGEVDDVVAQLKTVVGIAAGSRRSAVNRRQAASH
jgi:cysteine desulfurase